MTTEIGQIEAALIAFGASFNGDDPPDSSTLVCEQCDHVPFATQRALTRHRNKQHPQPPPTRTIEVDFHPAQEIPE
jgi:hypothetical protein